MPKFVTGTYVEERDTFSLWAAVCWEPSECSRDVSVNACIAHAVLTIDHFRMCNTGLDDSVQPMVERTTFALKVGAYISRMWVSSTRMQGQPWVPREVYSIDGDS